MRSTTTATMMITITAPMIAQIHHAIEELGLELLGENVAARLGADPATVNGPVTVL